MEELLTLDEVAHLLKMSKKTVYRRLIDWRIPLIRIGRLVRIDRNELTAALQRVSCHY